MKEKVLNNQQGNTNVSSFNQSGGITAHTVTVGTPHRTIDARVRQQLDQLTAGKRKIEVNAVMGDSEAFQFATEITNYLKGKGAPVDGVDQVVYSGPVFGQSVKELPDEGLAIIVGARQN